MKPKFWYFRSSFHSGKTDRREVQEEPRLVPHCATSYTEDNILILGHLPFPDSMRRTSWREESLSTLLLFKRSQPHYFKCHSTVINPLTKQEHKVGDLLTKFTPLGLWEEFIPEKQQGRQVSCIFECIISNDSSDYPGQLRQPVWDLTSRIRQCHEACIILQIHSCI